MIRRLLRRRVGGCDSERLKLFPPSAGGPHRPYERGIDGYQRRTGYQVNEDDAEPVIHVEIDVLVRLDPRHEARLTAEHQVGCVRAAVDGVDVRRDVRFPRRGQRPGGYENWIVRRIEEATRVRDDRDAVDDCDDRNCSSGSRRSTAGFRRSTDADVSGRTRNRQ